MVDSSPRTGQPPAWYALKTQSKREHIAAAAIRSRSDHEVFCPRITYLKQTRRGRMRFTEALFPGYLFIHCDIKTHYRHLMAMPGIGGVVRYGQDFPAIPECFIEELKKEIPAECRQVRQENFQEGSEVVIAEGPFMNIKAIVSGIIPVGQRINLLLEFLGRQVSMDLPTSTVLSTKSEPKSFLRKSTG